MPGSEYDTWNWQPALAPGYNVFGWQPHAPGLYGSAIAGSEDRARSSLVKTTRPRRMSTKPHAIEPHLIHPAE
jgi:hypothetical protein